MSVFAGIIGGSKVPESTLFSSDNVFRKPAQATLWETKEAGFALAGRKLHASPTPAPTAEAPVKEQLKQEGKKRKIAEPKPSDPEGETTAGQPVDEQPKQKGKERKSGEPSVAEPSAPGGGTTAGQVVDEQPKKGKKRKNAEPRATPPVVPERVGASPATDSAEEPHPPLKTAKKAAAATRSEAGTASSPSEETLPKKTKRLKDPNLPPAKASKGVAGASVREGQAVSQVEAGGEAEEEATSGEAGDDDTIKVPKTAEEEAEQLSRTVFVGNLPARIKPKALKAHFSKCGVVESVRLRSQPLKLDKKLPRRAAILGKMVSSERGPTNGFVVFKHLDSMEPALLLNMTEVQGHHIRVDRAGGARKEGKGEGVKTEYDRSCSVFVGNLPFDVKDEEVITVFSDGGEVTAVRCVRDAETNIGKGFGYVLFSDRNGAKMALAKDGTLLRKRHLRVTPVVKVKSKPRAASLPAAMKGTGAEGRLERKGVLLGRRGVEAPEATWQGARTKGAAKVVKPAATLSSKAGATGSGGRSTKRPAVAARKAKQLGQPAPVSQKKNSKFKGGKTRSKLGKPRSK